MLFIFITLHYIILLLYNYVTVYNYVYTYNMILYNYKINFMIIFSITFIFMWRQESSILSPGSSWPEKLVDSYSLRV